VFSFLGLVLILLSHFLSHQDQYVFLNQCVLDIIRAQKDSKVDLIYQNTTAMTIYENLEPVSMFGKTNGYIA
jgi:receptor-type tyrosine-protein phosphatase eta